MELAVIGSLFLIFVPAGFTLVHQFDKQYRQEAMHSVVELSRVSLSMWIAVFAGRKKSVYRTINEQQFIRKGDKLH